MIRSGGGMNSLSAITNIVMYPSILQSILNSMEREVVAYTTKELLNNVNLEVLQTAELCEEYTGVLEMSQVDHFNAEIWKQELIQRRQYLSYLLALQNAESLIENLQQRYLNELVDLKELNRNKASITKD